MNRALSAPGLAAAAAILILIAGCHSSSSTTEQAGASTPPAAATARITAAPPVRKTLRRESVQPGQIEAFEITPLMAKLPSYVQKYYVDIGDRVRADQPIVDLFLPELKDELRQKEAARIQAQAQIELAAAAVLAAEAAVATAQANIRLAEAGLTSAVANVVLWQSNYKRISQLVADGSLDRKLEDETRNSLKAAEAALGEAHAKVDAAKTASLQNQADVAKAKAAEAVARTSTETRKPTYRGSKPWSSTRKSAPYAAVVTERNVNRGDFVQPASVTTAKPLFTVARTDIVRVFVAVPEMDSPYVQAGRTGYVSVQALPDRIFEGKVTRTSWVLGANRTLNTELDLPNPNGVLRPGMYATAHIVLQEHSNVYVLPSSAIVRQDKRTFCWAVKDGRAMRTPITTGLQVGNDVEVTAGLKGEELVVQSSPATLEQGQQVEVAKPEGRQ